jgi:hypothetical protein
MKITHQDNSYRFYSTRLNSRAWKKASEQGTRSGTLTLKHQSYSNTNFLGFHVQSSVDF